MESDDLESSNRKTVAVSEIAASIQRGEPRFFFVALVGYYIEGYPYPASGLSVDPGGISVMRLTDDGFLCHAMFTPEQLRPEIIIAKGTVQFTVDGQVKDFVPVQVEVKFEDIWAVLEIVEGEQVELYKDMDSLEPGMLRFHTMWTERMARYDHDRPSEP